MNVVPEKEAKYFFPTLSTAIQSVCVECTCGWMELNQYTCRIYIILFSATRRGVTSVRLKMNIIYIRICLNTCMLIWSVSNVYTISEVKYNLMQTDSRVTSILFNTHAVSLTSCAKFCMSTSTCNGFNIATTGNADRRRACEAVRLDFSSIQSAVQETGWKVYQGKIGIRRHITDMKLQTSLQHPTPAHVSILLICMCVH